jgi:hypothetical protein
MNNCDAYRANAEACAKLAETVSDPCTTLVLLNMAEAWLRLAAYAEHRTHNLGSEHLGADSCSDQDENRDR